MTNPRGRRNMKLAVAAASIVLLVWPAPLEFNKEAGYRPELKALVSAVGTSRVSQARLSGGFKYGSPPSSDRTSTDSKAAPAVRLAATELELQASKSSSPDMQAAAASGLLVTGNVDHAIDVLSGLLAQPSARPAWMSDLAAGYLMRVERTDALEDAVRALDAASSAVRLSPLAPEARFNLALAAEWCGLTSLARDEWGRYSGVDPDSPWTDEADQHVERLKRTQLDSWAAERSTLATLDTEISDRVAEGAARQFPGTVRELLEDELLPRWGEEWTRQSPHAGRLLSRIRQVAAALERTGGDQLAAATIANIDSLLGQARQGATSHSRISVLARGLTAFGRGRAKVARGEYQPAAHDLEAAKRDLAIIESPLALAAAVHIGTVDVELRETGRLLASLPAVAEAAGQLNAPATRARALFLIGLAHWYRFEAGAALAMMRRAMDAYASVNEHQNTARVANSLAAVFRSLHDRTESWKALQIALGALPGELSPLRRYLTLYNASLFALEERLPSAALAFQGAALEAVANGPEGPRAEGLVRRAFLLAKEGRSGDASVDLVRGRTVCERLADRDVAEYIEATADVVDALLAVGRSPVAAADRLARCVAFFERADPIEVPPLRLARARALRASGDARTADRELDAGIRALESRRSSLSADLRTSYFGDSRELFSDLILSQLRSGRSPQETFATVERAKARTLSERLAPTVGPRAPHQWGAGVRGDTAIVSWFVLPDRLVCWVVRADGITVREVAVSRDRLATAISALEQDPGAVENAAALSKWLIAPITDLLPDSGTLVLSPYDILGRVAPALLVTPSGHRLIEDYVLVSAPSVLAFRQASDLLTRKSAGKPRRLLVVADPDFDHAAFPSLARLPGAMAEARAIAPLYEFPQIFTGESATRHAILDHLPAADVIHISAHGQVNESAPALSHLVVAPSDDDGGVLLAKDLSWPAPVRPRLVVLGSCRSAAGPYASGEGVLSLASPFLQAGVPSVVAALWNVDDDASRELLVRLHKHVAGGMAPAEALRAAQRELMASPDARLSDPRSWAGFVAIGGAIE
jgi:CHAT domain-containing protein